MGRPRKHPRTYYRAIETGFYVDQETGEELEYYNGHTLLPDGPLARKLHSFGVFEPLDGDFPLETHTEIERVAEPAVIEEQ